MRLMLTHLTVYMLAAANNSHLVTLTKDGYVGIGSYRVIRRVVILLSLSGYYLLKKVDKNWFFPAFGKRPASFKIDIYTEDTELNSFIILHDKGVCFT